MKYFQNLLLLGIIFSTILFGQSIEIPHKMMNPNTTLNIPIFIYNVSNLESIIIHIEYNESIILVQDIKDIIDDPMGILDGGYTFHKSSSEPGIIILSIGSATGNLFSGSGMIAQIPFQAVGQLGDVSPITLNDPQMNTPQPPPLTVNGSIEIILDELTITGQDNSETGAEHSITLGMCDGCSDGWRYGEDEYDYPNPQDEYTNIHFYHPEWLGQEDDNGNPNEQTIFFSTDYRKQHSFQEITSWGIRGYTGGGLALDIPIKLSWDLNKLSSNSINFKIFIYIGETGHNMQAIDNIIVSQSELYLGTILVKMGGCPDTEIAITYYQDFDGDGDGSDITAQYCSGYAPDGWVTNNDDDDDDCYSNEYDCTDTCGGDLELDCSGICDGNAIEDNCGICDNNPLNNCDQDCAGEWDGSLELDECNICGGDGPSGCNYECGSILVDDECDVCGGDNTTCLDCNDTVNGSAELDNCGVCDTDPSNDCIQDCAGEWGGTTIKDICETCGGDAVVESDCDCDGDAVMDCSGVCGGTAADDECDVCGGDSTTCLDCLGTPNGLAELDNCGTCDSDPDNDCVQDCAGEWGGNAEEDECEICNSDPSNDCIPDCTDNETNCVSEINGGLWDGQNCWGGSALLDDCGICDNDHSNNCIQDCNGDWGGIAVLDNCEVCDDDSSNNCEFDCNNNWGGGASYDHCQICAGGLTGLIPCEQDCNQDWGGYAFTDDCGVCDSDNNNNNQCFDCNSEANGSAIINNCGECILEGENITCEMDCNGDWGGNAVVDECNICGGNENNGNDICDIICPPNNEAPDCNGDCDGSAVLDKCGICVGGQTGNNTACIQDCSDEWGGTKIEDLCGICDAYSGNNNQCVDCNGMVYGLAEIDNCGECVEDLSDSSYECEQDCDGIWGGNHPPTFPCQNGTITCNYDMCNSLTNDDFLLPQKFDISRIYPNPFNPQATIDFEVSEPTMVQLNIYNLKGQKVDVLKDAFTLPGNYSVIWNGTNHPSGIYFVILHSSNSIIQQKMMLIK